MQVLAIVEVAITIKGVEKVEYCIPIQLTHIEMHHQLTYALFHFIQMRLITNAPSIMNALHYAPHGCRIAHIARSAHIARIARINVSTHLSAACISHMCRRSKVDIS